MISAVKLVAKSRQSKLNNALKKKLIQFSTEDIKFIIIKEKREIDEFIKTINRMNIDKKEMNELITKIITFQEINEDY